MMLQDAESYVRVQNIYNPENFDRSLRSAAEFIAEHSNQHKTLPATANASNHPRPAVQITGLKTDRTRAILANSDKNNIFTI